MSFQSLNIMIEAFFFTKMQTTSYGQISQGEARVQDR